MMLHFLPRYVDDIVKGRKRATVRIGKKNVKVGDIVYLSVGGRPFARAKIVRVKRVPLKSLSEDEIRKEGHRSLPELIKELRNIYPAISPEDEVTYIEWRVLEG